MYFGKKGQKCNEKSHTETSYIYFNNAFINTDSRNSSEINSFFDNSCRNFKVLRGTGKNDEKRGFKSIKNIFSHK